MAAIQVGHEICKRVFLDSIKEMDCCLRVVQKLLINVPSFFQEGLDRANKQAYKRPDIVQKFTVLPEELSVKGEELGPTLKVINLHNDGHNHALKMLLSYLYYSIRSRDILW